MKRFLKFILIPLAVITFLAACSSDDNGEPKVISVWSFVEELPLGINDFFIRDHPDKIKMELTLFTRSDLEAKLDTALAAGNGPDLWSINAAVVNRYVNSDVLPDMSHLLPQAHELGIMQYVIDLGTDTDGILRTLSFQATPGGLWYRQDLAEYYLGFGAHKDMQMMLSSLDGMVATAMALRDASNGTVYYAASVADLVDIFLSRRESPFVVDDTIVIDSAIIEFLQYAKFFVEERLVADFEPWGPEWFAGISDSNGRNRIFSYNGPPRMLGFVLRPNTKSTNTTNNTYGDWTVIEGPGFFCLGGTFIGVNAAGAKLETAMKVFEYLTLDPNFIRDYATETGDFPASTIVAGELTSGMSKSFLGGQNHFERFNAIVGNVRDLRTEYQDDEFITNALVVQALLHANGSTDLETAINDFQTAIIARYPHLSRAER